MKNSQNTKNQSRNIGTAKIKTVLQDGTDNGLVSVNIKTHNDKNGGHPHVIVEDLE